VPRGEGHPVGLSGGKQASPGAVGDVVMRGDGGDIGDLLGCPELPDADVGQADVPDDALLAQLGEGADLVLERDVGCAGAVQVVQVEVVQAEPLKPASLAPVSTPTTPPRTTPWRPCCAG
jgi:hypothetical protein